MPPTVTVALDWPLPPAPVQTSVNTDVAVKAPVVAVPEVARLPVQPPDAVQAVAFVELQVSVAVDPLLTVVGDAASVTTGAGVAGVTVTVALADALPPAPVQLNAKVVVADNEPVDREPEVSLLPVQPLEAVQAVAFVVLQVSVLLPPLVTDVGLAARLTVGAGADVTMTVVLACVLPPAPVQLKPKAVVDVNALVVSDPEVALAPLQPPDAVQAVALVLLQVRVTADPLVTDAALEVNATVGTGGGVTDTVVLVCEVPPGPVQDKVNEDVAANGPVDCVPLIDLVPLQPPEAAQELALVAVQVKVEEALLAMAVGFAVSVTATGGLLATVSAPPPQLASSAAASNIDSRNLNGLTKFIMPKSFDAAGHGADSRTSTKSRSPALLLLGAVKLREPLAANGEPLMVV